MQGVAHPVEDFLFTYYSLRPAALRRWHPGYGVALADGAPYAGLKGYVVRGGVATVSDEHVVSQRLLVETLHRLLVATAGRAPQLRLLRHARVGDGLPAAAGARCGTPPGRCGSAARAPTTWWSRTGSPARTSTRSGSSPTPRVPSTPCDPGATTGRRSSSRAACTPGWTSTSTPSGSRRWCRPSWSPTASSWPATSACSTCARRRTTCPRSATPPCAWRPPRASRSTPRPSAASPSAARPLRQRLVEQCERLLAAAERQGVGAPAVSQAGVGEPTPVTLSHPGAVFRDESWSNVRTV